VSKTKRLVLQLVAYTRVEYAETHQVPADITGEELAELAQRRYAEVDGGDYVPDPDYWERGDPRWTASDPDPDANPPTHIVTRESGNVHLTLAPPETQAMSLCRTAGIQLIQQEGIGSWHFDLGNSTFGPIGMAGRVNATSAQAAAERLLALLPESVDAFREECEGGEYAQVYFNPSAVTSDIFKFEASDLP